MKRFRFKFETVEKHRKNKEDECLRVLAKAQQGVQLEKDKKEKLIQDLNLSLFRREILGKDSINVVAFHIETDFITGQKQRILQADHAILRANRNVEKAMRAYLHARRQSRVMELLREKDFEEFKKEKSRREMRELDDLYVMRAGRRE